MVIKMVLVIGGIASGKREYVKSLGFSDAQMSDDPFSVAPVAIGVEKAVALDPDGSMTLLAPLAKKQVVVCREVGSGVIPATREERDFREASGRLSIALAQKAEKVVRLVSGIPVVIKEEKNER